MSVPYSNATVAACPFGLTVPFNVAVVVPTPLAVMVMVVGAAAARIVVGSLAVLLAELTSPPPETVATLVTLVGALARTFTVTVMGG